MIKKYASFVHKQAWIHFEKYRNEYHGNQYTYDDFCQEASIGFIEALRNSMSEEYPLSPYTLGCAKNNIRKLISRNLLLHHDSVHRSEYKGGKPKQKIQVVNANDLLYNGEEMASTDYTLADVEYRVALEGLSPLHRQVAFALSEGISKKQLVTSKIVSRYKLDIIIEDIKAALALEE